VVAAVVGAVVAAVVGAVVAVAAVAAVAVVAVVVVAVSSGLPHCLHVRKNVKKQQSRKRKNFHHW
jgi:hypothetical protein